MQHEIRRVPSHDTAAAAQLLYDFNREYDDPTPPPDVLAARLAEVVAGGETALFVGGEGPDGVLVVRFRPDLWSQGLEAYVAELYVRPGARGDGLGRALMEAGMDLARERGAVRIELGTSEDDRTARALYESLGFDNHEGRDGPLMYVYERDL